MNNMPNVIYIRHYYRRRNFLLNAKSLFNLNILKIPQTPFINSLNLRSYNESKKDSDLSLNVLIQFLTTLPSS